MAIVTRYEGDANGVVNIDGVGAPIGSIVSTGIGKHPTAFKIYSPNNLTLETGVGAAVETIIRSIEVAATILMYQVDALATGSQISLLVESTGWANDAAIQAAIVALGVRAADPTQPVDAFDFTTVTVSSAEGFKLF